MVVVALDVVVTTVVLVKGKVGNNEVNLVLFRTPSDVVGIRVVVGISVVGVVVTVVVVTSGGCVVVGVSVVAFVCNNIP